VMKPRLRGKHSAPWPGVSMRTCRTRQGASELGWNWFQLVLLSSSQFLRLALGFLAAH
jgi:hypothetical protein